MLSLLFPEQFLWGAAISSYQTEGGNDKTNWGQWETSPQRLAALEASGELEKYGLENFICGRACDHYTRYRSDFRLAKAHGHNAIRCGSEPGRVMPCRGTIDGQALRHYADVATYLRRLKITPYWNLWHWTLPTWWEQEGGWLSPYALTYWSQYVAAITNALGHYVRNWITLNETNVFSRYAYLEGRWPPQQQDTVACARVNAVLQEAHMSAVAIIKAAHSTAQVGIAHSFTSHAMTAETPAQRAWKHDNDSSWNYCFLEPIIETLDFVGVNYYQRIVYGEHVPVVVSDLGWELYPQGIYETLRDVWSRWQKPLLITESGLADATDRLRPWYLWETLLWVHRAMMEGIPILGHLVWSLIDNFEWADGFWPRFGLVAIDRAHRYARTPRLSAYLYRDIIAAHGLTAELVTHYAPFIVSPHTSFQKGVL